MPPEGLESSVDGLGRPVRAVGVVEEREDVRHAAFEGASERDESGASGRRSPDSEGFDELGHHAPSLPTVLLRVAGDDLLVDAVREGERLVGRVAKQLVGAFLLCISSSRCFVFSHVFFSGLGSCMHFPYFSGCAEVFLPNMRASLTRRLWPVNSRSRPWCTMRSMIAAASLSSAKTVPHLLNSMFVVNMMLRLS